MLQDHSFSCFTSIAFSKHVILERQGCPHFPPNYISSIFLALKMETGEFPHLNDFLAGCGLDRLLIYVVLRYIPPISFRLAPSKAGTRIGKRRCHWPSHFITRLCSRDIVRVTVRTHVGKVTHCRFYTPWHMSHRRNAWFINRDCP
jgi:hypothetical protein